VRSPVFVLSSIRSGSTLLRCMLNTHPRVCAPHELHLADLRVELASPYVQLAMQLLALDVTEIEHLLWDRMLHHVLTQSGKDVIVDKTPGNLLLWRRLAAGWPDARYIFLIRNPSHILASAKSSKPVGHPVDQEHLIVTYLSALIEARRELAGLTIRYEDLVSHPVETAEELCDHLKVEWEPGMVNYGQADHGPFQFGIGDFGDKIRAGRVLPGKPLTDDEVPECVRPHCNALGYADQQVQPSRHDRTS